MANRLRRVLGVLALLSLFAFSVHGATWDSSTINNSDSFTASVVDDTLYIDNSSNTVRASQNIFINAIDVSANVIVGANTTGSDVIIQPDNAYANIIFNAAANRYIAVVIQAGKNFVFQSDGHNSMNVTFMGEGTTIFYLNNYDPVAGNGMIRFGGDCNHLTNVFIVMDEDQATVRDGKNKVIFQHAAYQSDPNIGYDAGYPTLIVFDKGSNLIYLSNDEGLIRK